MPGEANVVQYLTSASHGGGPDMRYRSPPVRSANLQNEGFKGIRFRPELGRYISEIRPAQPRKRKIWLGTYKTAEEAARAFDAGIFYTKKQITYNFEDSPSILEPLPENLSPEQEHVEIQKKAKAAAARAQPTQVQKPASASGFPRLHEYSGYHQSVFTHETMITLERTRPTEIQFPVVLDRPCA